MEDIQIKAAIKKDLTWLQAHERLILAGVVALVIVFGIFKLENILANKADAKAAVLQARLDDAKENSANLALQATQTAGEYKVMVDILQRQNASLATAVAQRQTVLVNQQAKDKVLPPSELANRWQSLIGGANGDITVSPGGYVIGDSAGRATVLNLEEVPVLKANLADETQIADNRQKELDKANSLVSVIGSQVSGLQGQIVIADASCKADIAKVKADSRRSKRNWFAAGFVAGLATRLIGHF